MGFKGCQTLIESKSACIAYPSIKEYLRARADGIDRPVVVVDFYIFFHKFARDHLGYFFKQISQLVKYNVTPLYVIDGKPHYDKSATLEKRKERRGKILANPDSRQFERVSATTKASFLNILHMFDLIGVPYIKTVGEADAVCSAIAKSGLAIGCLSDDTDMMAYGCPSTIRFTRGGGVIEYHLPTVLEKLDLTHIELIDLGIFLEGDSTKIHYLDRASSEKRYNKFIAYEKNLETLFSGESYQFTVDKETKPASTETLIQTLREVRLQYTAPNLLIKWIGSPRDDRFTLTDLTEKMRRTSPRWFDIRQFYIDFEFAESTLFAMETYKSIVKAVQTDYDVET